MNRCLEPTYETRLPSHAVTKSCWATQQAHGFRKMLLQWRELVSTVSETLNRQHVRCMRFNFVLSHFVGGLVKIADHKLGPRRVTTRLYVTSERQVQEWMHSSACRKHLQMASSGLDGLEPALLPRQVAQGSQSIRSGARTCHASAAESGSYSLILCGVRRTTCHKLRKAPALAAQRCQCATDE